MSAEGEIPDSSEPIEERLLFLQENLSNFVKQYNLPLIEAALVVSKYLNILLVELQKIALIEDEVLPDSITQPWPIKSDTEPPRIENFPLDKLMQTIDQDRMDIFDTIIRRNIRLGEAPSYGESIIAYDSTCKGAVNYLNLAQELIKKNR